MQFSSIPIAHFSAAQRQHYGETLSILINQHYRYTKPLFAELEQSGVFLGNGWFAVAVIQTDSLVLYQAESETLLSALEQACEHWLSTPLYYAIRSNGVLHLILCYPRLPHHEALHDEIAAQLYSDFNTIIQNLCVTHPQIRAIISDVFWGESELYLASNSLHHAMEYDTFLTDKPQVKLLNTERQLHGAFVEDFYVYRKLSNQIVEQLTAEDCVLAGLSDFIVDTITQNSSDSMESIHHHIQMFVLTFTEQLSASGVVDSAYMQQHHVVRRSMGFETEAELRQAMNEIIQELHRQYTILAAKGQQLKIQAVRDYVTAHISDCNLSVNLLAEQFSISPSQLTKQFRRYYAVSLHQFIQITRLQAAKHLIAAHPDWTLKQIGSTAGYIDVSTMYRAFKKVDGTSPGLLKNQERHRTIPN